MSKKRKRSANQLVSETDAYEGSAQFLKGLSGYDGANQSARRGWVYWPTLDTKRELDTYSHRELMKKARWLLANFGLPNRICGGLADMIGYLTPLSNSGDEKWDQACDSLWADRAEEAMVIDAAGQFNIKQFQIHFNKSTFSDGDILPVLIQGGTDGIAIAAYEGHQIVSPVEAGSDWINGVKINKFRRHLAYGIADENGAVKTIQARDALYYSHPNKIGVIRPPTILAQAINNMIDITEILSDVKLTIKVAAQMGFYLRNAEANSGGAAGAVAIASSIRQGTVNSGTVEAPEVKSFRTEDFFRAGGGVANLPKGVDVGTLQDARPHPNQVALLEYLVRDISWSVGVAPDILWDIQNLKGANNRLINSDLNRWIACRLLRQRAWMKRFRAIWVANEIKAGRLSEPPGSAQFWRAVMLPQASLTADIGKTGSLNIELVKNQMMSLADWFAEQGKDWETELVQISKEKKKLRDLGLVMNDIAAARAG